MLRLDLNNSSFWLLLGPASLLFAWLLRTQGLPAAFLLGPMISGIVASFLGVQLVISRRYYLFAQALIGCAVAESINSSIVVMILRNWPVVCMAVAGTVAAGTVVGWLLVKLHTLPGTTAAWGLIPGGASIMVAMAEEYGADSRLVALMQYIRMLIVVVTASAVANLLLNNDFQAISLAEPNKALSFGGWRAVLTTSAVALTGVLLARVVRIPAGAILIPVICGGILNSTDVLDFKQPYWMQAIASAFLGWHIGLHFNRAMLIYAFRLLPRIILSALLLIALCALSGWLLVALFSTDPLTAYLSTSPGGLDTMILIAMGSKADVAFIVAVQTLRLCVVILIGPAIARLICKYA